MFVCIYVLLALVFFYTGSAVAGFLAVEQEPGTFLFTVLTATAGWLYKIGHVPTAILLTRPVYIALCYIVRCRYSLTERERDLLAFAVAAVIFIGLCNTR